MGTMGDSSARQPRLPSSPWLLWLVWIIWLPFLVPGIVQLWHRMTPLLWPCLAALAVLVAAYAVGALWVARTLGQPEPQAGAWRRRVLLRSAAVLGMLVLDVVIQLLAGTAGVALLSPFIYTAAYSGTAFRSPRAVASNLVVLAAALVTGAAVHLSAGELVQAAFIIAVVSFMTTSWTRSLLVGRKLHAAQDEIARLAAADERLRIARDLHDLLGQKLSFIALKSELARHLVASDPPRAEREIAEVESSVRSTLQEVREAVTGYRKPSLARELRAAREVLSAAGIRLEERCDAHAVARLGGGEGEALAWAVREGVTNVVRHSRAGSVVIELRADAQGTVVEVKDDGTGGQPARPDEAAPAGNGLRGLRERFGALGGTVRAVRPEEGGFALMVSLPHRGQG